MAKRGNEKRCWSRRKGNSGERLSQLGSAGQPLRALRQQRSLAAWAVLRAIGWTSVTGILSNIAVLLSAVLALLAGVYTLLDRWHLLALPAATARAWIDARALPIVSAVGNLKRE